MCLHCPVSVLSWLCVFGGKHTDLHGEKLAPRLCFLLEPARRRRRNTWFSRGILSLTRSLMSWVDWKLELHLGINGRMWTLLTKPKRSDWSDRQHRGRLKESLTDSDFKPNPVRTQRGRKRPPDRQNRTKTSDCYECNDIKLDQIGSNFVLGQKNVA